MKLNVPCKSWFAATALVLFGGICFADEIKLTGTWTGFAAPVYTKLVIGDDGWLTYCAVSSCRNIQCFDMAYEGSLDGSFAYKDGIRSWTFERLGRFNVQGRMTTASGTSAKANYALETLLPPSGS